MLGIIRCRTLKCKQNLPKRDRFILVGFIWGNAGTRWKGRTGVRHAGASWISCGIPRGQKMANMSTVASLVSYRPYKIIDTTVNMFIDVGTQKHATGRFDQFEGISRPQRRRLGQFWLLLKKVTVLIFAIFCPRGLEGERQSGPRGGVSRAAEQKRGRRLSCVPVFGRYLFPEAEFTPPRRTASCTGRRRSRPGRAARRACPFRRCRRRELPKSRRRCGSWTGGVR